jgi:hypothetical protein
MNKNLQHSKEATKTFNLSKSKDKNLQLLRTKTKAFKSPSYLNKK